MRKNTFNALVAGATLLVLGGCMTGPDYVRPPVAAPTAWRISDRGARIRVHATGVGAPFSDSTVTTASPIPSEVNADSRS